MATHILITGASSGIGSALAKEMARRGFSVGLVARRSESLEAICKEIREEGGQASFFAGDVGEPEDMIRAIESLEAENGPTDILVANAGISGRSPTKKPDLSQLEEVMRVNFFGAIHSTRAVLPGMLKRKRGHLVVVSSVAGFRGLPLSSAYSASKAAITTYWESQRVELRPHGIACTTVQPGYIKTPLTDKNNHAMPFMISSETAAKIMANGILARRKVITFPWRMKLLMGLIRILPPWLYDRLLARATSSFH
mgnify:CR=1 FL=1